MAEEQGVALTWPELIARELPNVDDVLDSGIPEIMELMSDGDRSLYFESLASHLARCLVCAGVDRCESAIDAVAKKLDEALPDFRKGIDRNNAYEASGVLDFVNLLRCLGKPVPKSIDEAGWLAQIAPHEKLFSEKRNAALALAALATGQTELVPKFIGGGKLPKTFKPGETFQFNVQGFARYLAVAIDHGAAAEDAGPAWGEFVQVFPRKLATNTLDWPDLFYATRAFLVHLEKRDAGEVAQDLYDYVRE
jgi:hypothetical protein